MPGTTLTLSVNTQDVAILESVVDALRETVIGTVQAIDGATVDTLQFNNRLTPNEARVFDSIQVNKLTHD